ncbi:OmpA family protein [Ekhidna sp. MALMAid0563]|uniref:OmpA family protein n=1 Tax=Ekhidna sp. MALMAid0563 TaxID=3143937 RepID=UPI0032E039BA
MKKKTQFVLSVLLALFLNEINAQQSTLMGHQDLLGVFNPSLNGGKMGQVSYLYRYQWEGLGPSSNTLFFKYPLKRSDKPYAPHTIGSVFQYEDLNIVNRARLEFFMSNTLANFDEFKIGFGINAGLSLNGVSTDGFNVEELVDPELANVDRKLVVTNRLGLSVSHSYVDIGFAGQLINGQKVSDYHSSASFKIPIPNPKLRLNPILVMRMTESFDPQMEGQLKTSYDDRISFVVGYRENFGAIFQLGIRINQSVKVSYGLESPNKNTSALGMTHELFGSYFFESPAEVQHRKDSLIKVRRDSVNRARIAKYQKEREEELARKDSLAQLAEQAELIEEQDSVHVVKEPSGGDPEGVYTSFSELEGNASDNTHVILDHIGFEPGLYLLTPDSYAELDKLFNYIRHHKSLHLEIQGHTDNSGTPESNLELSRYRALAVFNYLVSRGVDPARMNVVGYGENQPLYPNDTPVNRELNRRIEIVFIKK